MASAGSRSSCPTSGRRWSSPPTTRARPTRRAVLREALRAPVAGPPLRELARPGQTVAISMCDGTRAQPRDQMIPAVLEELGVPDADVVILVATGTHRGNTDEEIRAMLGDELVERVRVVNHDARDRDSLVYLGEHGRGVPVWINRLWVEADLRITTGFVEPHFFAGFSGGPKLVTPGLAGLDTVLVLHDAARIGDPQRDLGRDRGQPRPRRHPRRRRRGAAALRLRRDPQPRAARDRGLRGRARPDARAPPARRRASFAMRRGPASRSTSSSRATPAIRSTRTSTRRSRACRPPRKVVKPGGLIVCAAECRDGFPGHGSYRAAARVAARRRASSCARSRSPTTSRPTSGRSRSRPTSRTTRGS